MPERLIQYCRQTARVGCDGNCKKAWGLSSRPKIEFDPDEPDDYAFLADDELGEAPADPGSYEGGVGKPTSAAEFPTKWCVRECERCEMSSPGEYEEPLQLSDFSKRLYNQPWKHPEAQP